MFEFLCLLLFQTKLPHEFDQTYASPTYAQKYICIYIHTPDSECKNSFMFISCYKNNKMHPTFSNTSLL